MKKTALIFFTIVLVFSVGTQEEEGTPNWYLQQGRRAIDNENYEYAVRILEEGKSEFPGFSEIAILLGDLYDDQELYSLAIEEYLLAEQWGRNDFTLLMKIATTYGFLNMEEESIAYLERLLVRFPDNTQVIGDLGWMYFKTHRLGQGEALLSDALDRLGFSRSLAMTLATIYADMYEYDLSKEYYLLSIEDAIDSGASVFASVALYNLSLLEQAYYRFSEALEYTERSIAQEERSSGHIARGEIFEMRMDFQTAFEEYNAAVPLDDTPLSKIHLAWLHEGFGMTDAAFSYADEVYEASDMSWMYYFGTDTDRFYMERHELYRDLYENRYFESLYRPSSSMIDHFLRVFNIIQFKVLSIYHGYLYSNYCYTVGSDYLAEGSELNGNWTLFEGLTDFPAAANRFLTRAQERELAIIPASRPYYLFERGRLFQDTELLRQSVAEFDPEWEAQFMTDALIELAQIFQDRGETEAAIRAVNRIFEINPGVLRTNGLGLTVDLNIQALQGNPEAVSLLFARYLTAYGLHIESTREYPDIRYSLVIGLTEADTAFVRCVDRESGGNLFSQSIPMNGASPETIYDISTIIIENLYSLH
ncbi:MAG: tetratricopeptide repeat protein [Spirochaetia bacterium]